jgi:hypothetical protein
MYICINHSITHLTLTLGILYCSQRYDEIGRYRLRDRKKGNAKGRKRQIGRGRKMRG